MAPRKLPPGIRSIISRDGTIVYQARWYDRARKRHAATFDTIAEADAYRQEQLRARRLGGTGDPSGGRTLLSVWFWRWMDTRRVRPSTKAIALSNARTHLLPQFGEWRLCDLRPSDISRWVSDMLDLGLADATVAKNLQLLTACLNAAVAEGLIAASPAEHVRAPEVAPHEARFLLPAELLALERAMDQWWRLIVPFLADTGLRIGELAALRVRDLNMLSGNIRVVEGAIEVPKAVSGAETRRTQSKRTKTEAGGRTVPTLTSSVLARVRDMIAERGLQPDDHLFTGRHGAPISPGNWRKRVWNVAVEAAGLGTPGKNSGAPTPHALRHTAVSLWIAAGIVEPLRIAKWAGHRSVNTVYRIYGHLLPEDAAPTRTALDQIRETAQRESEQKRAKEARHSKVVGLHDHTIGERRRGRGGSRPHDNHEQQ